MLKSWALTSSSKDGISIWGTNVYDAALVVTLMPRKTDKGPFADIFPETDTGTMTIFF